MLRKAAYGVPVFLRGALLPVTVPKAVPLANGKGASSLTFPVRRSDSGLFARQKDGLFYFRCTLNSLPTTAVSIK